MYSKEKILQVLREIKAEADTIKPYVVVAQPRRDLKETPAQKLDGYEGLHVDFLGFSHGFVHIGGEKVDVARNYLIEQFLESGAKYLFFVGEDTVVPYDGFVKLHETAENNPNAIVCGVYYIKLSSPMIMIRKNDFIIPANIEPGQVYEAWQTGLDCALIPIELLKNMKTQDPDLPFCCIAYKVEDIPFIGEDNFFQYRIRKMGYKVLVNTDVQCLHMDLASGKYTAHPSVKLENYFSNIPITTPLTMEDKQYIDKRWVERLPEANHEQTRHANGLGIPIQSLPVDYSEETLSTVAASFNDVQCTQNYYEVARLCERIKTLKPKTILEIGVEKGGSMNLWLCFAAPNVLYLGVDTTMQFVAKRDHGSQIKKFIEADSCLDSTLDKVKETLGDREVDFLFIDGSHDELAIRNDLDKYSPLVRKGGIVALHDINVSMNKEYCEGVKKVWQEIKESNKTAEEFINTEAEVRFGIGIIYK